MNFDFLTNDKAALNVILNAVVFGGLGMLAVWFTAPDGTPFLSKGILAGGFAPVIAAVKERLAIHMGQ